MTTGTVAQSKYATPEQSHHSLLENFYQTWVTIEKNGCPPPVLRCFVASLRLAIGTLNAVEGELSVLLQLAEERLVQIENEDAAVAAFEHSIGRTK